jgi:hypothetical protein
MSADWIVRTLVPIQFDQWAKTAILGDDRENAARWANQLRRLDPITDIAASANASQFADCASIAAGEAIVDTPQDATRELKSNEHTNIPYGDPIDYASSPALTASYVAEVAGMAAYVAANTKSDEDPEYAAKYAAEGANVVAHMPEIARLVWNASLKLLDQLILVTNATKICLN